MVGIGYSEGGDPQETWLDFYARRNNDLSPVRDEAMEKEDLEWVKRPAPSGDGERFHQFIRNELIPLIEKDFRADPTRRILMGHSLGGSFGAFALLHEPELFDAYVLASPWLRLFTPDSCGHFRNSHGGPTSRSSRRAVSRARRG